MLLEIGKYELITVSLFQATKRIMSRKFTIAEKNIAFYDSVSKVYNSNMEKNPEVAIIRNKVENIFTQYVKSGIVLDFGSGTGEDLKWLLKYNYRIICCEPSTEMRAIASAQYDANVQIRILNDQETDFNSWNQSYPFNEKLNGMLANFAVINSIDNIDKLFSVLASKTDTGATFLFLVLHYSFFQKLRLNVRSAFLSCFGRSTFHYCNYYGSNEHYVFAHSKKSILKAANKYFSVARVYNLKKQNFHLYHMLRK